MRSLRRDQVELFYEQSNGGGAPLVLVHGWCCDHSYFAPQLEHFAGRGYNVVAVDLRGHGGSGKPKQAYTMQVFADDLAWMCGELELSKPVVVGHSMGGIVGFDLAARYPDLPAALVMLNSAVVLPPASRDAIPAFLHKLADAGYRQALGDYVAAALFLPSDDPRRRQLILEAMPSTPQHVIVSAFEGLRDYEAAEVAGGVAVPCLYIAANEPVPRSDMALLRQLLPKMLSGQTVGSGHFCQLEVPEQVNAMIERFLAISLA